MRVAKNYQKYPVIGEPYEAHGYWFIKIRKNVPVKLSAPP